MADQHTEFEDFMHFKDPFFDELTKRASILSDGGDTRQYAELKDLISSIKKDCEKALVILEGGEEVAANRHSERVIQPPVPPEEKPEEKKAEDSNCIEGLFDGQNMCGADGKQYVVPVNYASKSKLVEGDTMKLTIADDGSFIFKQIRLTPRRRVVGTLGFHQESRSHIVQAEGCSWKVLGASVSYYHARQGDEIVILIPAERECAWAAVDNVIKKAFTT